MTEAVRLLRDLADELSAYDIEEDPVPDGIDVPDDYEAGIHDAARRVRAVLTQIEEADHA